MTLEKAKRFQTLTITRELNNMKGSKEGVERDENLTQEEAERLENKESEPRE